MKTSNSLLLAFSCVLILTACEQSEPPEEVRIEDELTFSGYTWDIKSSEAPVGPGPNPFSERERDVYVDSKGRLHLNIKQHNSLWYSTEVVSQKRMGYGTYRWTVTGDLKNLTSNVVLGLFTWDNETFDTDGNSEVDIEFAYWGNDSSLSSSMHYSVQPVAFGPYNNERTHRPEIDGDILIGTTTHEFIWTPELIQWKSWKGSEDNLGDVIATWSFNLDNPPKRKFEGGSQSEPIVIPAPGANTNARINLWIASHIEPFPINGEPLEVIIDSFSYESL